jgi:CRP/FNR family transcriptional regulator, cyclic AMP receptor protein
MPGDGVPICSHRARPPGGERVDTREVAELLAGIALFSRLSEATRLGLAERLLQRKVHKGHILFYEGDPGESMVVLAEGAVRLYISSPHGGVVELARHSPPAVFGEVALLDEGPRSATAEAVEASTLLFMRRADLARLLQSDSEVVVDGLLRLLGEIVRRTTEQAKNLALRDIPGRVAFQLLQLDDHGAGTRHLPQSQLAQMVGATRQAVNIALQGLQRQGLVRIHHGGVEILDHQGLRDEAAKRE